MSQYYNYKTSLFILFISMLSYLVLIFTLFQSNSSFLDIGQASQFILLGFFEILMLLPLILYLRGNAKSIKHEFRVRWYGFKGIFELILIAFGMFLIIESIQFIIEIKFSTEMFYNSGMKLQSPINLIFAVPLIALITPVVEESIFRGYLIRVMMDRKYSKLSILLIQALLFALIHFSLKQAPFILFAGLILGLVAYSFHSIVPGIIIHGIFNILVLIEVNIPQVREYMFYSSAIIPLAFLILGLILLMWGFINVRKKVHVHRKRRGEKEE